MMTLQYVNILVALLLCQQAFVESAVEECSGEAEYSILGMMLGGHIFKKITGAPLGNVCLRECYRDVRCQSFNYVISKETCELNNRTKEARPEDFVPNSDRYYFKRDMNRGKLMDRYIKLINDSHLFITVVFAELGQIFHIIVFVLNAVARISFPFRESLPN